LGAASRMDQRGRRKALNQTRRIRKKEKKGGSQSWRKREKRISSAGKAFGGGEGRTFLLGALLKEPETGVKELGGIGE